MTKVAINGFGRIGKCAARIILDKHDELELVAVNSSAGAEKVAYMLKYDSTQGNMSDWKVAASGDVVAVDTGHKVSKIKVVSDREPANLPWSEMGVQTVLECTGAFRTSSGDKSATKHIQAGCDNVIISAPGKSDDIATGVMGVNDEACTNPSNGLVSNASCTTNCIAPALKALVDNYTIKSVSGITVHAVTSSQEIVDGYTKKGVRDGRSAMANIIPTKTGAAKAVEVVIPELVGKTSLVAARVPVVTGSMVYLTVILEEEVSAEEVNSLFKRYSEEQMKGVLQVTTEELVSSDVIGNSHSCIVDANLTNVKNGVLELTLWYDNEWGYANRLVEMVKLV